MWKLLMNFGAVGDYNSIALVCPPPAPGQQASPMGFYDGLSVAAAYNMLAVISLVAVLAIVTSIFLGTQRTLGPSFVKRWYKGVFITAAVCALLAFAVLSSAPTHALADSCETNPTSFSIRLPAALITTRALVGLAWGAVAYVFFSFVLTVTAGRFAATKNGFFHNRGCPWPRFVP